MLWKCLPLFRILAVMFCLMPAYGFSAEPAPAVNPPAAPSAVRPGAIGTIVAVEGTGWIPGTAGSEKIPATGSGNSVYTGDLLETGPGSRMAIMLLDDTRFTLGENSLLRVAAYTFDNQDGMALYTVPQGTFVYIGGATAKKKKPDVRIATAYGAVLIRGADGATIWGGPLNDEYGIYVMEGEAIIQTNRGRIHVSKGEGTIIHSINAIPKRAGEWDAERINWIKNTVAVKDADTLEKSIGKAKENLQPLIDAHREMIRAQRAKAMAQPGGNVREIKPVHHDKTPSASPSPSPSPSPSSPAADAATVPKEEKKDEIHTVEPKESAATPPPMPEAVPEKKIEEKPDAPEKTPDPL